MMTPDANKTIAAIGCDRAREIADVFGVDLTEPTGDVTAAVEWHCGVEGKWWPMSAQLVYLTDLYGIRWTWTAEAGADDVEIVDRMANPADDADELREWLLELARNTGSCDGQVRPADEVAAE